MMTFLGRVFHILIEEGKRNVNMCLILQPAVCSYVSHVVDAEDWVRWSCGTEIRLLTIL